MQKKDLENYENKIVDKVFAKLIKTESDNLEDNQALDPIKENLPTDQLINTIDTINHESLSLEKISNELENLKGLISNYIDNKIQETQAKDNASQDINSLSSEEKIKILSDNIEDIKNQLSNFAKNDVINNSNSQDITNKDIEDKEFIKDNYISFLESKLCELTQKNMFDTLTDLKDDISNNDLDEECVVEIEKEKNEGEDLKINPIKTEDLQNQNTNANSVSNNTNNELIKTLVEKMMLERSKNK